MDTFRWQLNEQTGGGSRGEGEKSRVPGSEVENSRRFDCVTGEAGVKFWIEGTGGVYAQT